MQAYSKVVDYVVIGAGTAGCVIANRLSEDSDCSVLLLEAGGRDWHPLLRMPVAFVKAMQAPAFNWRYKSEPEPHLNGREIEVPRGRVLGGSSSINGMFHIRGHQRDFDEWHALGCEGWAYADVLPYFKRYEASWRGAGQFHGAEGPVSVRAIDTSKLVSEPLKQAAIEAGYRLTDDYDGQLQEGFGCGDVTIDAKGRRASTSRAYLHPVRSRPNLGVETRALTHKILIENGRAVGVEYSRSGQLFRVRAMREVVVSGGAYNSPQLLMLSGIGPADDVRRCGIEPIVDLPGVGRNLVEHARLPLTFLASSPVTFTRELRLDRAALSVLRWALLGKGPFATQICSGTFLLRTLPELERPDIQMLCNPVAMDARLWFPGAIPAKPHSFYVTLCLAHQKSRGHMTLRSASPSDAPRISFNLFSDPEDLATMRRGIRAARAIYRCGPQAALTGREILPGDAAVSDAALNAAIAQYAGITHHPIGTCKMGLDRDAVVDPQLRVRGVAGLRVADASVMPTIPGANTMAATIMIGEKASDLIRGRKLAPEYVGRG
ncbi:MAG: GMC family oxidoreductase N-terminal domain-containing protein [Telluria sp.]